MNDEELERKLKDAQESPSRPLRWGMALLAAGAAAAAVALWLRRRKTEPARKT